MQGGLNPLLNQKKHKSPNFKKFVCGLFENSPDHLLIFMPGCNQIINSRNMSSSDGDKLEDTSIEK